MKTMILFLTCIFIAGCASKSKQKEKDTSEASMNNTVERNDTLELLSNNQQEVTIKESENQEQLSETMTYKLEPIPRDIPTGQTISPDSLSMRTEYDYYPLSTTKIKVIINNLSHYEYECGESYSLAYFDEQRNTWESLPTNPIINSILWIFLPENPTHEQTIELYTSEVPNRPGKYRIYKAFNRETKVAYAEFELVDKKGVKRLREQIDNYWRKNRINSNDTTAQNIHSTWIQNDDGDTIYVGLMNNTPHFQEMFRRKVVSYSAVSHGAIRYNVPFTRSASSDTLHVTM